MIDNKLIEAHQWVVDMTQKKPGWWAEQTIMAATCVDIVRKVLSWEGGWDAVMMFVCLVVSVMLVRVARNEILLKSIGESKWIRAFFLGMAAFNLATLSMSDHVSLHVLDIISGVLMLSFYCFAACNAPRPRKRKEKLVLRMA